MRIVEKAKQIEHLNNMSRTELSEINNRFYESLTPKSDIKNGEEYFAALDWALNQEDIRNIAIAGPYGSGKSSIIRSYLKKNSGKKVLNISLAAFNLDEMVSNIGDNKSENEKNKLEIGILKQLFYSVDTERIPKSRYRKIQNLKIKPSNILITILFVFLFLLLILFFSPKKLLFFVFLIKKIIGLHPILTIAIVSVISCAVIALIYKWYQENYKFSEIKIGDKATLQERHDNEESIFDKNMDEIIYFFEMTGHNIVVIEDLDRFESTNIFVALRELNNILNHYENIKTKVTFIYAIKDDMFLKEGERTKFFDFIIPVIPYISSTNSGEVLRERLKFEDKSNHSTIYGISGEFISLISPYITDMRDLVSICNEFNIIKNTLKGNQELNLNDEHLFALVVFKNLYPKDFADLENESENSIILQVFTDKNNKINYEISHRNEFCEQEQEIINKAQKEILGDIKEIKLAIIGCLTDYKLSFRGIIINDNEYSLSQLLDNNFDILLLKGGKNIKIVNSNGYISSTIQNVDEKLNSANRDYFERIIRIQKGIQNLIEESRIKIEQHEAIINELHTYTVKRIIQEFGIDFLNEKVKCNKLLVFLLRQGFIDEHFENYINYFHPNSILKQEMNFILGIRNFDLISDYNFPLLHVSEVFNRLQPHEFKQKQVLNFDLVDYVLETQIDSPAANYLFVQLSDHSKDSMNFIRAYFDRGRNTETFISTLVHNNSMFWIDITNDNAIPYEKKCKYLSSIFLYSSIDDIKALDRKGIDDTIGVLSDFLVSNPTALEEIQTVPDNKQIEIFEALGIEFFDSSLENVNENVKQDILENWYYKLNEKMISELIKWKAPAQINILHRKNYSAIRLSNVKEILEYIHKYFVEYIENLIIIPESNTDEDIDAVDAMLERLLPDNSDLCLRILDKEHVIWDDITQCCKKASPDSINQKREIWNYLLTNDRIQCSWANFIAYFDSYGSTDEWISYFSNHIDELILSVVPESVPETVKTALFNADLGKDVFRKFIKSIWLHDYENNLSDLEHYKIEILIEESYLPFTAKYWLEMETIAPDLRTKYAELNKNSFIESLTDLSLDMEIAKSLLKSEIIPQDEKPQILYKIQAKSLDKEIAEIIKDFHIPLDYSYVKEAWKALPFEGKKDLLLNQLDYIDSSEFTILFAELGQEYEQLTHEPGKKYSLPFSDYNLQLLEKLRNRKFITKVSVENEKQMITGYISKKRTDEA